jgi:hypothetical protein
MQIIWRSGNSDTNSDAKIASTMRSTLCDAVLWWRGGGWCNGVSCVGPTWTHGERGTLIRDSRTHCRTIGNETSSERREVMELHRSRMSIRFRYVSWT